MRWILIAAMLLMGSSLLAPVRGEDEVSAEVPPPTTDELKVLLEEAASFPADVLRGVAEMGPKIVPKPETDLPLTICLWMMPHGPECEFQVQFLCDLGACSGESLVAALEKTPVGEKGDRLSVLQRSLITDVNSRMHRGELRGTVTFRVEGELGGHFEFTARIVDGAWRVVEFWAPLENLRTSRQPDGHWQVERPLSPGCATHQILRGDAAVQALMARRLAEWDPAALWHVMDRVKRAAPIYAELDRRTIATSSWQDVPLEDVIVELDGKIDGVSLVLDLPDFFDGEFKVTSDLDDVSISAILDLVTEPRHLTWFVDDGKVRITTGRRFLRSGREELEAALAVRRKVSTEEIEVRTLDGELGAVLDGLRDLTGIAIEVDARLLSPDNPTTVLETQIHPGWRGTRGIDDVLDRVADMAGLAWEICGNHVVFTAP